jgi:hypothetical protein
MRRHARRPAHSVSLRRALRPRTGCRAASSDGCVVDALAAARGMEIDPALARRVENAGIDPDVAARLSPPEHLGISGGRTSRAASRPLSSARTKSWRTCVPLVPNQTLYALEAASRAEAHASRRF